MTGQRRCNVNSEIKVEGTCSNYLLLRSQFKDGIPRTGDEHTDLQMFTGKQHLQVELMCSTERYDHIRQWMSEICTDNPVYKENITQTRTRRERRTTVTKRLTPYCICRHFNRVLLKSIGYFKNQSGFSKLTSFYFLLS